MDASSRNIRGVRPPSTDVRRDRGYSAGMLDAKALPSPGMVAN